MARIYISSSYQDLRPYREAVRLALQRLGQYDVAMETYAAEDQRPVDRCLGDVADADLYIGVFAWRYGNVPAGYERSVTELEYREAVRHGIPCLIFLLDEDAPWPRSAMDTGVSAAHIETLRAELQNRHLCRFFTDAVGLANEVTVAVANWLTGKSTDGGSITGTRSNFSVADRVKGGLPPVWNVEPRNPEFTGRDAVLTGLRERLRRGGAAVVQALRGLGGVGKTQIAIEYSHRYSYDYDLVWWIAAEDPALIGEQIAALGVELGLVDAGTDTAPAVAVVKVHLRRCDRWLLVFDNAEDATAIREWLPGGPGHVIVTSRAGGWEHIAAVVVVDLMARSESVTLLRTCHPDVSAAEADRLAGALGDLPLALTQAGGFLSETATSVEEYLRLLEDHTEAVLREGARGDYSRSLAAAIGLSTDRLAHLDSIGLAVVRLCAFLAPETVPVSWLAAMRDTDDLGIETLAALAGVANDPMALRRGVGSACRFGLATSTRDGVRLHRLTQAVIRNQLSPADRAQVREHARALLVGNHPGDPEDPATWPAWAKMVPHLLAVDPADSADADLRDLACNAAWYMIERGDVDASARLAAELHERWRNRLGPDDYHVLWVARDLARARREQGQYELARKLYEDSLARYRRVLGDDHPHTLRLAHGFAIDLHMLGQYDQARQLQDSTRERYQRVLGDDHPHTLHSANHLAVHLRALGEYDKARRLHEETLASYRRVLGDDHPDTLRSANNLAVDLQTLGQCESARRLQEDTLARYRRVLGDEHPDTLRSANSLSETLHELGQHESARRLQEDTLARYRRVLGDDHPETRRSAGTLEVLLSDRNKRAADSGRTTPRKAGDHVGREQTPRRDSLDNQNPP